MIYIAVVSARSITRIEEYHSCMRIINTPDNAEANIEPTRIQQEWCFKSAFKIDINKK